MTTPLISLALPIKNGLPSLTRTIEALQRQTYRHFELIVQDAGSTDGSVEYVRSAGLPRVDIVSQLDSGHGQAFNRAWSRCRGTLACMLAADEFLEDDALEHFVRWYGEQPSAVYIHGITRLWQNEQDVHSIVRAGRFDLMRFLMGDYVPPAGAGCYNRALIGADFHYDEGLKTCPDFDFFLRLGLRFGSLAIVEKDTLVLNSIRDRSFTTFHPQSYDQIAQDKLYVLDRFFLAQGNSRLNQQLRKACTSSLYCWLASLLLDVAGETPQLYRYIIEAGKFDPGSEKVARLVAQTRSLTMDPATGQVRYRSLVQPSTPPAAARAVEGVFQPSSAATAAWWAGAETHHEHASTRVTTAAEPWSYAALIPFGPGSVARDSWHWIEVSVNVRDGQVGIGIIAKDGQLRRERTLGIGPATVCLLFSDADAGLLIRNGSMAGRSVVDLLATRVSEMSLPGARSGPASGPAAPTGAAGSRGDSSTAMIEQAAARVYELTDHSVVDLLDHMELIGPDRDACFERHTDRLRQHTGGYQCSGMSLYLCHLLRSRGYRTLTYNSGTHSRSHMVSLVEADGRLYMFDVYVGATPARGGRLLPFDEFLGELVHQERVPYERLLRQLGTDLRKHVRMALLADVDWPAMTDEQLNLALDRSEWPAPQAQVRIVERDATGPVTIDLSGDEHTRFIECRVRERVLSAVKTYTPETIATTYRRYDERLEEQTGARNASLLLPLNLHADDLAYFLAAYPYLDVVNRYAEEFRRAAETRDYSGIRAGRRGEALQRDLHAALEARLQPTR